MQYMLLIYGDEQGSTPEEQAESMPEWLAYTQWLRDQGYHLAGDALHPTSQATTVRHTASETVATDGPFAETREQLGGYFLVECASLDEAIAVSERMPVRDGSVEIRPVMLFDAEGQAGQPVG